MDTEINLEKWTKNFLLEVLLDTEIPVWITFLQTLFCKLYMQTVGYSFLPPKKLKPTSQSFWCTKHLHGINWSSGYKKYSELEKLEAKEMEFFAKGYEKCKILSEFLETKIINLDDYACPKVQFLILKDEEYD